MNRVPLLLLGCAAALVGCYERVGDVVLHEPHVYKGKVDPLIARMEQSGMRERLRERLVAVQAERERAQP